MTSPTKEPVPADIKRRAEDIASVAADGMPRELVADLIERAILAERDRCRKIVYSILADYDEKGIADDICTKIRAGAA